MTLRTLQRRVAKVEKSRKPRLSPFARWFGSFEAWVEQEVMPGIESGALDRTEMIFIVACLRRWETEVIWERPNAR